MAFHLKSKLTSKGLAGRTPGKVKLINNSKTAFHQENDPNFVITEKKEALYGENAGKDVVTGGYIKGKPGTVSGGTENYDVAFANITDDELDEVKAEGYPADLAGFTNYSKDYFAGTLPSQRVEYEGDVINTDGEPSYSMRLSTNILNLIPEKFGSLELPAELPYGKQKEILVNYLMEDKKMDDAKKGKVLENFKTKWEKVNGRKLKKKKKEGTDGTTQITELKQTN